MLRRSFLAGAASSIPLIGVVAHGSDAKRDTPLKAHQRSFMQPHEYRPQPQARIFHKYDLPEWTLISGDRMSGKTWAAAGKVAEFLATPHRRIAVIGPKEEFATHHLKPIVRLLVGPHNVAMESASAMRLRNDSYVVFFGETMNYGCGSRFDLTWLDTCELVTPMRWLRLACNAFIVTSDYQLMLPTAINSHFHFSRDGLAQWLKSQPIPPGRQYQVDHERLVSGTYR